MDTWHYVYHALGDDAGWNCTGCDANLGEDADACRTHVCEDRRHSGN